jgi:hypothetical protein
LMLLGRAVGGGRTGRFLQFGAQPHNRLLVSVLNAMGVEATSFGHADFGGGGPLPGLT